MVISRFPEMLQQCPILRAASGEVVSVSMWQGFELGAVLHFSSLKGSHAISPHRAESFDILLEINSPKCFISSSSPTVTRHILSEFKRKGFSLLR